MRIQWAEGELRGQKRVLKGLGFRIDVTYKRQFYGRSFRNVAVQLSDGDHTTMKSAWNLNAASTPSMVFSASFNMPSLVQPVAGPAPWNARVHFPFSSSFAYAGTKDLLIDTRFAGGTLANNGTWRTTDYRAYYFDSVTLATVARSSSRAHGLSGLGKGCIDGGSIRQMGGETGLAITTYGPTHATPALRNSIQVSFSSDNVGPSSTLAFALTPFGQPAGTGYPGVTCNKIYFDITKPVVLFYRAANATGSTGVSPLFNTPNGVIGFQQAWVGTKLWLQCAWDDSKFKALRLSSAVEAQLQPLPRIYNRSTVYHFIGNASAGLGPSGSPRLFPILRFTN